MKQRRLAKRSRIDGRDLENRQEIINQQTIDKTFYPHMDEHTRIKNWPLAQVAERCSLESEE